MKEEVRVYNNGLDIESGCRIFQDGQWLNRIVVCKKPSDVCEALLTVYKNRRDRRLNRQHQAIVLHNYVGIEKGAVIKKQTHTLSIITESRAITLAFNYSSTLIQWDAWLRQNFHESALYYMQMRNCNLPGVSFNLINREVRCHLHDSRLAIVSQQPPRIVFYSDLNSLNIFGDVENHSISMSYHQMDGLHSYITKNHCEGPWLPNVAPQRRRTSSIVSDAFTGMFQNFGLFRKISKAQSMHQTIKASQSKPSLFGSASDTPMKKYSTAAANHMNYVNDGMDSNPNYVNCMNMNMSRHSSMSSTPNVNSISLPEYVNVNRFVVSQPLTYRSRYIQQQQSMDNYNMPAFDLDHSVRRRSDNSVSGVRSHFPGRSSLRSNPKGRSMVDFTTMQDSSPYDSISDRQESWRRAKRFIHAFKQKSSINLAERDSNTDLEFPKSSSTGALRLEMDEINQGNQTRIMSAESMSELDDMPPSLDMAVNGTNSQDPLREKILFEKPPQGLIKLKEDVTLQPPSLAFKRSLFSQIRGSFSKYDGEKATHGYQQGEQSKETDDEKVSESSQKHDERKEMKSPREPSPLDGISTAVNRRQDRMKEYDRRASAVSTHKVRVPFRLGRSSDSSGAFTTKHVFVHIRDNSLSHSESARSSNESLSSDARSKISIRKRTNSPPRFMAPQLPLPRQISANTLKPSTSSSDSMNSCQTTRSLTPPLPKRAEGADSSSSDESMINPLAYVRASIARRPLKKAMSLTKLPESNKGAKKLASAESCADKNNRLYSSRRNARRNAKKIFSSSAGTSHTNLAPYQS